MSTTDHANVRLLCQHEPSAVFTATGWWIESFACECAKCGRLVAFYPDERRPPAPVEREPAA